MKNAWLERYRVQNVANVSSKGKGILKNAQRVERAGLGGQWRRKDREKFLHGTGD